VFACPRGRTWRDGGRGRRATTSATFPLLRRRARQY
jgi:hypothetical protein